jgi:hypothetical protein
VVSKKLCIFSLLYFPSSKKNESSESGQERKKVKGESRWLVNKYVSSRQNAGSGSEYNLTLSAYSNKMTRQNKI